MFFPVKIIAEKSENRGSSVEANVVGEFVFFWPKPFFFQKRD